MIFPISLQVKLLLVLNFENDALDGNWRNRVFLEKGANQKTVFRITENDPFQSPNQTYLPFTHIKLLLFLIRWPIRHFD